MDLAEPNSTGCNAERGSLTTTMVLKRVNKTVLVLVRKLDRDSCQLSKVSAIYEDDLLKVAYPMPSDIDVA